MDPYVAVLMSSKIKFELYFAQRLRLCLNFKF